MIKGVGVDLAQITRLRRAVERWDERFLRRVFTEAEIAYCRRRRDPIPHLAARFAAKEATLKALGTGLAMGVNWREMEVRRERGEAISSSVKTRRRNRSSHRSTTSRNLGISARSTPMPLTFMGSGFAFSTIAAHMAPVSRSG